jgi:hypothetical protein
LIVTTIVEGYIDMIVIVEHQLVVPKDLEELYQLYAHDTDNGQLIQDLQSRLTCGVYMCSSDVDFVLILMDYLSGHSPRLFNGNNRNGILSNVYLSQIAEEDLTSASTSVTSFHLPNHAGQQSYSTGMLRERTASEQDLFTRVPDHSQSQLLTGNILSTFSQPPTDSTSKQQLVKGNSTFSYSSDSPEVPLNKAHNSIHGTRTTHRKAQLRSPSYDSLTDLSTNNKQNQNKVKLRKQTKYIAARAAQRRANLHHQELMDDIRK